MNDDRTTFVIWSNGDPSVGIPGQHAEVLVWVDPQDSEHLEFVRSHLSETFKQLWDERVYCMTAQEYAKSED
jgi:hypothetical protein